MTRAILIHGGVWEDMDAERFWGRTEVADTLADMNVEVETPDRLPQPADWRVDVDSVAAQLPDTAGPVIAASNGCTVAVKLALEHAHRVSALLLAMPATCGDAAVDADCAQRMTARGAPDDVVAAILTGQTLRGLTDAEISTLANIPTAVMHSQPPSNTHQRHTSETLLQLLDAEDLGAFPEPPRPQFAAHRRQFCRTVADWLHRVGLRRCRRATNTFPTTVHPSSEILGP